MQVSIFAACAVYGCAAHRELRPTDGNLPSIATTTATTAAEKEEDLRATAANARTPIQCEQEARRRASLGDLERGFAILLECTGRDDFIELRPLLREPWLGQIRKRGLAGLRMLARIVARAGDGGKVDLGLLRDHGFAIMPLDEAEKRPEAYRNRFVLMRGRLERKSERAGSPLVAVEIARKARREAYIQQFGSFAHIINRSHDRPGDWVWGESGRTLLVGSAPDGCRIDDEELQQLLIRVTELAVPPDAVSVDPGALPRASGRGELIDCHPDLSDRPPAQRR